MGLVSGKNFKHNLYWDSIKKYFNKITLVVTFLVANPSFLVEKPVKFVTLFFIPLRTLHVPNRCPTLRPTIHNY